MLTAANFEVEMLESEPVSVHTYLQLLKVCCLFKTYFNRYFKFEIDNYYPNLV